jgi:hypothetical protein
MKDGVVFMLINCIFHDLPVGILILRTRFSNSLSYNSVLSGLLYKLLHSITNFLTRL